MAAVELFCHLFEFSSHHLTPQESHILELDLFTRIYEELMEFYMTRYREYFLLIKPKIDKESDMQESR